MVCLLAAAQVARGQFPEKIETSGDRHHIQGIAADTARRCVYVSYTTTIKKYDFDGNLLGSAGGLTGHLGCLAFNPADGRVYGSLEHKLDEIGRGLAGKIYNSEKEGTGFYLAIFDGEKINRPDMDASADSVMTTVFIREAYDDYFAEVENRGHKVKHRYGCSGIDGTAIGPEMGTKGEPEYVYLAYGIYGDTTRTDNDNQVILAYRLSDLGKYERTLDAEQLHRSGPAHPAAKYFVPTGNTTYGVQNLVYDPSTGDYLMAVYRGKKPQFPNHDYYVIDGTKKPRKNVLTLRGEGFDYPYGALGLAPVAPGLFYMSHKCKTPSGAQGADLVLTPLKY